jgi:hypothetical protein
MYCLKIAIFLILGQICFSKSVSIEEDNLPSECQPDWYNTCHSNEECCSGTCYTNNGQWKDGLCMPKDNEREQEAMPGKCQEDWYNNCKSDEECCSGKCENLNDGSWVNGMCKPQDNNKF